MLGRALHARLDGVPVDGGLLVEGARHGAVVRRRRRTAAVVAATAAVLLVPGGVIAANGVRDDADQVAAASGEVLLRADDAGPRATAPAPTASTAPSTAPSTGSPMAAGPGSIPSPLLDASALPVPMVLGYSLPTVNVPIVPGQVCNLGLPGLTPMDGQVESWSEDESNRVDQQSLRVVVTRWGPGESVDAFAEAAQDAGACRFQDEGDLTAWQPGVGQEGLQRARSAEGLDYGAALLRTGDLLVGVELAGVAGAPGLLAGSAIVAETVARRLTAEGAVGAER